MRKPLIILATFTCLGAALPTHATADGFERITAKADLKKFVAGKTWVNEEGSFTIRRNGKLTGKFGGKSLKGAWKWSKGFWCRNGKLEGREIGNDCSVVRIAGNQLQLTQDQGKGRTRTYTRK